MTTDATVLDELFKIISERKNTSPENSYTAKLFSKGNAEITRKLGEESLETIIAALSGETKEKQAHAIVNESADLLYHLLVLWAYEDIDPKEVWIELKGRFGISGIEEKNSRGN